MQKRVLLTVVIVILWIAVAYRCSMESPQVAVIRELAEKVDAKTPEGVARRQAVQIAASLSAAGLHFEYRPFKAEPLPGFIDISAFRLPKSTPYFVFHLPYGGPPSVFRRLHEFEEVRELGSSPQALAEGVEVRSSAEIASGKQPTLERLIAYVIEDIRKEDK